MKDLMHIRKIILKNEKELKKAYYIRRIGIFGSFVRNEQTKKSDVDVLVEFKQPIGLFKFLELEEYLGNILGLKVDLVSRKALKPKIGKHIMKEVVMLK